MAARFSSSSLSKSSSFLSLLVASSLGALIVGLPLDAAAQPPSASASAPLAPPTAAAPQLPAATSAEPKVVEPAPGQAAAAAPSSDPISITATCVLGDRQGVDPSEAKTAADIVCHELARRGATNTQHEVRFGKLGSRTMVTLASRNGNAYDERRTFVTGLDEINVAGPRLADALTSGKPLEETRTVDNVLSSETTTSRVQRGSSAFDGGIFGMTAANTSGGTSAGFELGFTYRAGALGIGAHGRAGGIGSSTDKLSTASIDLGGRLYLSSGDFAPYFGAGLGLSHFALQRAGEADVKGSGFGAFGAFGVEMLRTHHVGVMASIRADLPFYQLQGTTYQPFRGAGAGGGSSKTADYVVPVSLNIGMMFH